MNRQGNNKITWTDFTWNPVTGCLRNCWYCYVKRLRDYDRSPTFHPARIRQPIDQGKPSRIFVCSTSDLFAEWVPCEWIQAVIMTAKMCQRHIFQFLTKNPEGYEDFIFPPNCWLGFTETGENKVLEKIKKPSGGNLCFVSFEPLIQPVQIEIPDFVRWVIIGSMTGPNAWAHRPDPSWVENVIARARKIGAAVFLKNNLNGIWPGELIQEFPNTGGCFQGSAGPRTHGGHIGERDSSVSAASLF